MEKIAHCIQERRQTIVEHLEGTATLAKEYVKDFQIENVGEYAYITGLAHDIGKYSELFQKKINGKPEIQVDHSTAGAIEMTKNKMVAAAFCVAGHHAGIPNLKDTSESCLVRRVKNTSIEDYSSYKEEIFLKQVTEPNLRGFSHAFFTRMLFSALTDADFLNTEKFMSENQVERGGYDSLDILYNRLKIYCSPWLESKEGKKEINVIRTEILKKCLEMGNSKRGMYSLTVPTGGGKTISSMAFALEHAVHNQMNRIIYVIPYTSIIELFRKVFGEKNVVEHHANVLDSEDKDQNIWEQHKLSTENWDAPIIVTTNVQFFESLFSNKSSQCRKLHNIANSVIVFDEAQMIPLIYLKPCVRAIEELVCHYHSTAVLCTATQPALDQWMQTCKVTEICSDFKLYYTKLKRTKIKGMGKITKEELVNKVCKEKQILVIVNKKKTAQEIYNKLPKEGTYHLSTYMIPEDRRKVIQEIKERLEEGKEVRLISTSLIEAGVDIDFPIVFRERTGIDSIVQAAGRCNREGKRAASESIVWVFELQGETHRFIEKNIAMTKETVDKHGVYDSLEAIQYYFTALQNLDEKSLDCYNIIEGFEKDLEGIKMPFRKVNEIFHLIEDNTKVVIIPIEPEAKKLTQELERCVKESYNYKMVLRKIGRYSVNLREYEYNSLVDLGQAYEIVKGIAVLQNFELYKKETGLNAEEVGVLMY